jgi:hypothetical protein
VDRARSGPRGNEGARQGLRLAVFRGFLRDLSAIGPATRAVEAVMSEYSAELASYPRLQEDGKLSG